MTVESESELPPAGNARRRILREHGIEITRSDFSNDELAATETWRRPGWYRAPAQRTGHRFWDGDTWADTETQPEPSASEEPNG